LAYAQHEQWSENRIGRSGRNRQAAAVQVNHAMNQLLFGDNINWLRDTKMFPDASVDLVYLDPPFNSNADYNLLFKEASGEESQAQFHAFTDTWHWADAADTYREFRDSCKNTAVMDMVESLYGFLRTSPMMAYIAMMAPRLVELRRVLKATGSLYLHCDPTASHYLRLLLDGIFSASHFHNEIIWKRTSAHANVEQKYGAIHDCILFYSAGERMTWNQLYTPYTEEYLAMFFDQTDERGRKYFRRDLTAAMSHASGGQLYEWHGVRPPPTRCWSKTKENMDELEAKGRIHWPKKKGGMPRLKVYPEDVPGVPIQDIWGDIKTMHNLSSERLGYPTQKPQALLERIIQVSSNPGDIVLDPFCGCGTTVHAAEKLGRTWIGIDITYLAVNIIKNRLQDAFGDDVKYEEKGQPTDFQSAKALAQLDKWQFQHWALSLLDARPLREGDGKGADRGVDGMLFFYESEDKRQKILVQVKGGGVQRNDVAALLGDVNNQKFAGGVLLTLEKPSAPMRLEAADAGRYKSKVWHDKDYPKIQILTIEGLLNKTERVDAPPQQNPFAKAQREAKPEKQEGLEL
jgi:site-specific DNA-methyltransferase (adenine-specific)